MSTASRGLPHEPITGMETFSLKEKEHNQKRAAWHATSLEY